jgi:DNA-binding NtrC family response regulator
MKTNRPLGRQQGEVHSEPDFDGIVGQSSVLKAVLTLARKVAAGNAPVLILGEAGSGKESLAGAIHRISGRRNHLRLRSGPTKSTHCRTVKSDDVVSFAGLDSAFQGIW